MFTSQTMSAKRRRDDDSDSDFDEERYVKKARPGFNGQTYHGSARYSSPSNLLNLPSRTPSPPRPVTDVGSMTPAQSEHGRSGSPESINGGPVLPLSQSNGDFDMDMDDDDFDVTSQPSQSPALSTFFMRPATLNFSSSFGSDSLAHSGRIPTPIHPTFRRGGPNGLGYPTSGFAGGFNTSNGYPRDPAPSIQPPSACKGNNQDMYDDRSRRIPSPISEDEDIPDTPTALTQSQLSRLSVSHANDVEAMDTESSTPALAPPPTLRGRKRSGALTGMGRFSMGYRDDCEKCRKRVPGHYSHFL